LLRLGLVQPSLGLVHRRIVASVVVTWVPPAVLTASGGTLVGGVKVPFLVEAQGRVSQRSLGDYGSDQPLDHGPLGLVGVVGRVGDLGQHVETGEQAGPSSQQRSLM
jgi:hypothetical protein